MKVVFDSNIYISFLRTGAYSDLLCNHTSLKYMSGTVLSELWAGAKEKHAERGLSQLQKPYELHHRIITQSPQMSIQLGQFLCDLPASKNDLIKRSSFVNDIRIAIEASSIGAILFTENKSDFELISKKMKNLAIRYISN